VEEDETVPLPIDGSLDLHTFVPKDVPSVVNDYIYAAHGAGLRELRLVHGRGQGIQRGIVQQLLDNHPLVAEFFDDADSHLGATIALLVP
jgi:DNA-nicking Smr family endonuclease